MFDIDTAIVLQMIQFTNVMDIVAIGTPLLRVIVLANGWQAIAFNKL
jgi:hypothetical protein